MLSNFTLVKACDHLEDGTLRVATPLCYPDGSAIDVFVKEGLDILAPYNEGSHGYTISDLGQTATLLMDYGIKMWEGEKRVRVVEEICRSLRINCERSELLVRVLPGEERMFQDAFWRIAQACAQTSSLASLRRLTVPNSFREDVASFIRLRHDLPFDRDVSFQGRFGNEVRIDYRVRGRKPSLVRTISAGTPSYAHALANEIALGWQDLDQFRTENNFVTVVNDDKRMPRRDDRHRLAGLSQVFLFPTQKEQLATALAG